MALFLIAFFILSILKMVVYMEKLFIVQDWRLRRKKWLRICCCMHLDIHKMAMGWAVLQNSKGFNYYVAATRYLLSYLKSPNVSDWNIKVIVLAELVFRILGNITLLASLHLHTIIETSGVYGVSDALYLVLKLRSTCVR